MFTDQSLEEATSLDASFDPGDFENHYQSNSARAENACPCCGQHSLYFKETTDEDGDLIEDLEWCENCGHKEDNLARLVLSPVEFFPVSGEDEDVRVEDLAA